MRAIVVTVLCTAMLVCVGSAGAALNTNDWKTAVRLTQKPFPGTSAWLMSCSSSEGGHGRFVMNHQGSGAGGWMQFMSGTFYAYVDDAFRSVRARGFKVHPRHRSWYSPLGQALTAGYMRFTGRSRGHWWGSGC